MTPNYKKTLLPNVISTSTKTSSRSIKNNKTITINRIISDYTFGKNNDLNEIENQVNNIIPEFIKSKIKDKELELKIEKNSDTIGQIYNYEEVINQEDGTTIINNYCDRYFFHKTYVEVIGPDGMPICSFNAVALRYGPKPNEIMMFGIDKTTHVSNLVNNILDALYRGKMISDINKMLDTIQSLPPVELIPQFLKMDILYSDIEKFIASDDANSINSSNVDLNKWVELKNKYLEFEGKLKLVLNKITNIAMNPNIKSQLIKSIEDKLNEIDGKIKVGDNILKSVESMQDDESVKQETRQEHIRIAEQVIGDLEQNVQSITTQVVEDINDFTENNLTGNFVMEFLKVIIKALCGNLNLFNELNREGQERENEEILDCEAESEAEGEVVDVDVDVQPDGQALEVDGQPINGLNARADSNSKRLTRVNNFSTNRFPSRFPAVGGIRN